MDEVGFVVQSVTGDGLIRFLPLGGWGAHTILAKRVRIITRSNTEILGVVGAKPPHFLTDAEREKVMKIEDMFIDVGARDAADVRKRFGIEVGDGIVPESGFTPLHDPELLLCKAFDNRVGMAVVVHASAMLMSMAHPNTVCAVGTVQEEVGVRGAQTAAHAVNPAAAIILEGTPADDLPGTAEDERQGKLRGGVQIRIMDPSAIMNRKFTRYAVELAAEHGIKHQVAVRKSGSTDARAVHLTREGVPTIVLGVPARYIHTHNSIIHIKDYLNALELVMKLLERLDEETVRSFGTYDD
jgi:putative aminopeptidase FrvX